MSGPGSAYASTLTKEQPSSFHNHSPGMNNQLQQQYQHQIPLNLSYNNPIQHPSFANLPIQDPNLINLIIQSLNLANFQYPFPQPQPSGSLRHVEEVQYPFHQTQPSASLRHGEEVIERANNAVLKARREILQSQESVTVWKVSQAALMALNANSWESLGVSMQQVPSLNSLIVIEGKVNTFIHCFVAVRSICSLYDLEIALCKNECVEKFEDLELGPLVRQPLAMHYFCPSPDTTEVFKITSEEILTYLHGFMESLCGEQVKLDQFLDYVAVKQSATSKERLNVLIQDLGKHVTNVRQAKESENTVLENFKKQMDDQFNNLTDWVKSFSSVTSESTGKHISFVTTSSGDEDDYDEDSDGKINCTYEDNDRMHESQNHYIATFLNAESLDRVSTCPYPSANEEMKRVGRRTVGSCPKRKKKSRSTFHSPVGRMHEAQNPYIITSLNVKSLGLASTCPFPSVNEEMKRLGLRTVGNGPTSSVSGSCRNTDCSQPSKRKKKSRSTSHSPVDGDVSVEKPLQESTLGKKRARSIEMPPENLRSSERKAKRSKLKKSPLSNYPRNKGLPVTNDSLRLFIETWKEVCCQNDLEEVLHRMFVSYESTKKKNGKKLMPPYPFIGLLNVAIKSIKYGMWDSMYDSLPTLAQHCGGQTETRDSYSSIEDEGGVVNVPVIESPVQINPTTPEGVDPVMASNGAGPALGNYNERDKPFSCMTSTPQAVITGRTGEFVAYKYFLAGAGETAVNWVNEITETGFPYDITVGENESKEYIEVKSTKHASKEWFYLSGREWSFAAEKGESFSIAHVVLSDNDMARVTIYKNPVRLSQLGKLRLAMLIPKQQDSIDTSWDPLLYPRA